MRRKRRTKRKKMMLKREEIKVKKEKRDLIGLALLLRHWKQND